MNSVAIKVTKNNPVKNLSCAKDPQLSSAVKGHPRADRTTQHLVEVLHAAPRSCRHGDEVWPNLYLGDMVMSHDRFGLWTLGITYVLNASHGKLCCKGSNDFYGTTVKYYGVPANDLPTFELSPFFSPAAAFIDQALTSGGRVLVHCAVGCVQQKRWIFPNRGFLRQLLRLERTLQSKGETLPK
ncbi:dual specificity protein phosphatase 13A family protein isoform X3 [Syngnathoides biaculeatus]|uniref:dual specificity protein phosphatase 13A family protein isoform X3 n=1 Tax=Syngnathoides biaculeatus TaxID=300417 RepID=UPI002ADD3908|nr:dual specificity protein phosphatase 13A family protein isoform X3 [Syngnathoides biaculeatus]